MASLPKYLSFYFLVLALMISFSAVVHARTFKLLEKPLGPAGQGVGAVFVGWLSRRTIMQQSGVVASPGEEGNGLRHVSERLGGGVGGSGPSPGDGHGGRGDRVHH